MNRIYRLVWCRSRGVLIVASELASSTQRSSGARQRTVGKVSLLLSAVVLGAVGVLHAPFVQAQSVGDAKLADLQSLVDKYDAPVAKVASTLPPGVTPAQAGQAVASRLPMVTAVHADAHATTPVAHASASARISSHGVSVAAGVSTHALSSVVSGATKAASGLPVAGKLLSGVGDVANTVISVVPAVHVGVGATASVTVASESMVADRRRDNTLASSHARALGSADDSGILPVPAAQVGHALTSVTSAGGNLTGTTGQVVGGVVDITSKLPVLGPVIGQVDDVLTSVTSGKGDPGATLGKVVGDVVNAGARLPVVGSTVETVGQALKTVTSGGNIGAGPAGQVGVIVGGAVNSLTRIAGVGPVVAKVGQTLEETTAQIGDDNGGGNGSGVPDQVIGGVVDATSKLPVVGAVIGQVGSALSSVPSGNGDLSGILGNVVGATSQLPVIGSLVEQTPLVSSNGSAAMFSKAVSPQEAVPVVPVPSATPTGLIVGNNGLVGTATQLLGSTTNSLFSNSSGYVTNGSLQVSNANFTQGYSVVSVLGLPVVNSTPVGTLLTTAGGAVIGGTGINSHLTLIGGVTSNSYIDNINNGAAGGLLGLLLPGKAPAWASTCANVLGVVTASCWAVNAAQDNQVLMGDGATANGSEEVVIGTNASHTLPTVDACTTFPGGGTNDPTNPCGLPTADYAAREGHSVVIGDSASGTANAQTILGANATSNVANSVALGYASVADRGAQASYTAFGLAAAQSSAGEVSIGAPGQERQITNVAAGSAATDAVNVAQLEGVAATAGNAVQYDDSSRTSVTLGGPVSTDGGATGGTKITNLQQGTLSATSTDAVNGAQLYATNSTITTINETGTKYFQANSTGTGSDAGGANSVAVGVNSVATGVSSIAMGNGANASSDNAVAIGNGATAQNGNAVSVGAGNIADGNGAVAMGDPNTATGQGAVALGYENQATGQGAIAMGSTSIANGASAIALGDTASATAANALAFGAGASASMANSIALGAGSSTLVGALSNYTAYGLTAPQTSSGELNVGNRQITGVAAGSADDDAVNVAQLKGVSAVASNSVQYDDVSKTTVTLAGPTSVDGGVTGGTTITNLHQGNLSATSTDAVNGAQLYATNNSITNIYNTGSKYFQANSSLVEAVASGTDSVAVGPVSVASGASSMAMGNGATASADDALALGAGANASMANSVALGAGSITQVGALTNYTGYALTAPQTSSGELNVGNRQITGVAAGSASDDAVNVAQLEAVNSQVQSVDKLAVKYDADTSGNATNTITLTGDGSGAQVSITNLAAGAETSTSTDAVNGSQLWHWTQDTTNIYSNYSLYNDIHNLGKSGGPVKYFNVNSTLADSSATGSNSIAIGPVATASGANSVAMGNGATASADNSVAIGAGSVADRDNTVSVGSSGSERQITNVAAGTENTDAVNVGQMNSTVAASTKGSVHYDINNDGSIDYNDITLGNGGGGTAIHNVAAGVANADAVNVGQLNTGLQQAVSWANSYTDQQVQQLANRANAGVAAAMAMAGLPQAYEPGKSMASVAGSSFRGESSLAIGVSTISEGGRWVYKLTGSTDTRGDAGVSIGAGMQW